MFRRLLHGTLYISFQGLLPADGILRGAKFTLHPTLAFSYIGSVTAWHSTSGHEPGFAAWNKEWNYTTFIKGAVYIAWAAIVLLRFQNVSCRSVLVGFAELTSVFGSV